MGKKGKREGGRRGGGGARGSGGGISCRTAKWRGAAQVLPARAGNGRKGKKIKERRKRRRGGENIPKNREGKGIPSLFRDGKKIPSLKLETEKISPLFRDGK